MNPLELRLKEAFDAAPTWRPAAADALDAVRRRVARRRTAERVTALTFALLTFTVAASAVAALRPGGTTRTVDMAGHPAAPSDAVDGGPLVAADPHTTTTTSPSNSNALPGRDPGRGQGGSAASSPAVMFPPHPTTTTGPAPKKSGSGGAPTTTVRRSPSVPPAGHVSLNGTEVQMLQGPSCWTFVTGEAERCTDMPADWWRGAPTLDTPQAGNIWFRWDIPGQPEETPTFVSRTKDYDGGPETWDPCAGGNPCSTDAQYVYVGDKTGGYWLVVKSHWARGTVYHAVHLAPTVS